MNNKHPLLADILRGESKTLECKVNLPKGDKLVIEVSRGSLLPYYLKTKGRQQGVYIRLGASNHQQSLDSLNLTPLQ